MKSITFTLFILLAFGPEYDAARYFNLVNQAEMLICQEDFEEAADLYAHAFQVIRKPFGKDVFNAALCCQYSKKFAERNKYLQMIINNSDDLEFVRSVFIDKHYLNEAEWQILIGKRKVEYDLLLRKEFKEMLERDQLFRPMYESHDDTIKANEIINFRRISELTNSSGFPSQIELGFSEYFRNQDHDIVLHHLSQRRSRDKTVVDLEPILFKAVQEGRFDPEGAIFYLNYQNDIEKGMFEVYATEQIKHPLLPDSLCDKIWLPDLSDEQIVMANNKRKEWNANTLEEIAAKTDFLSKSKLPFIFSSVRKTIGNLRDDFDKETALEQYNMFTEYLKPYKN